MSTLGYIVMAILTVIPFWMLAAQIPAARMVCRVFADTLHRHPAAVGHGVP